jgi:hypothetical protein
MTHGSLEALAVTPRTGDEPFTYMGKDIGPGLLGYWRWAYPDLVSNATRGVLAEYIVGMALRCVDGRARTEWDASDCSSPVPRRPRLRSYETASK